MTPLIPHFDLLAAAPGGVARLRELILTLAVQGKLVPQDPSDEPASVLLQKIRAEKDRLIAAKEIKRNKPLALISDEEVSFGAPRGWEWVRLGDLVNASEAGWSPSCAGSPRRAGHWGVLKVSAVSWGKFDPEANKELPADLQPKPEYEVQAGDFLLSRANTEELVARSVVVDAVDPRLMLSDKIIRLDVASPIHRGFLNLCNNATNARAYYAAHASGTSSSMKNVSREVVLNLPVVLPPLAEQARIVTRVEELMRLCDALESQRQLETAQHAQLLNTLLDTLTDSTSPDELATNWQRVSDHFDLLLDRPQAVDALEQAILQLALLGRLVPQHVPAAAKSELPIPQGWVETSIGDLATLVTDGTHKTPCYVAVGIKFVSAKDVRSGALRFDDCKYISREEHGQLSKRCRPARGDILVSKSGSIGTVVLVDVDDEFSLFESLALIKFDQREVLSEFLRLAVQNACNMLGDDEIKGVAVKHLHLNVLRSLRVLVPPLEEQHRIVARVNQLCSLCADLRQRLSASRTTQSHLAEALVEI